jgi:hypothetical protein
MHLNLPVEMHFRPTWGRYVSRLRRGHSPTLDFVCEPSREAGEKENWGPREDEYSPWEVRQDLLSKGTDHGTFTYFYGRFSVLGDLRADRSDPHGRGDFREWQQLIGDLVSSSRDRWNRLSRKYPARKLAAASKPLFLRIEWTKGKPVGVVSVRTALDAILASIQIDKMRGVKSKYCAECLKEFPLTTAHEREYCSHKCAHRVAMRRYRSRVRKNLGA